MLSCSTQPPARQIHEPYAGVGHLVLEGVLHAQEECRILGAAPLLDQLLVLFTVRELVLAVCLHRLCELGDHQHQVMPDVVLLIPEAVPYRILMRLLAELPDVFDFPSFFPFLIFHFSP